ncbi:FxSxx-COOH system tetratricopeptide repeat protein [Streptomyces justiciae]|uniref:FxSxx-COOH system tetratricopeptide repeat protein n=1 Tax=Streptomyces justiciae TaxID=2780140 RepID=UPI002118D5D8|nr:FxSxx-COOH system tetratricopeptide repeat protein [Streptomyces justiciae]MCW8377089.1 FxSxx-COOH system tetratricopeptide repeat protein [Streptomyces justiciae]
MTMSQGRIATFYSYKGGVGRSFLLSNSAVLLAQWGYRVLCIDWDLEAPGLHYYFRPYMDVPVTGLTDMALAVREGERVGALDHITPVALPDGATLDLIAAGGVGNDYVPKLQSIDWEQLYLEHDFGNVLESWRERWLDAYDVILVDSRTGISDSGGICTAQLPHILAYTFTANQQNVDGVLDVVRRASVTRNSLPYDRSRLLTLPLLCRFDMSEEYERAAEWREKLRGELKPSYDAWVPDGSPVERVLDNCTVPYSAYWSFGEDLPVVTEDFRNPQLISHSIASIAALIARNLEDARLFTESRDAYVDAAIRTGRRGGHYQYDFFISGTPKTESEATRLAALLAEAGLSSFSALQPDAGPRESLRPVIDSSRHLVLLARDSVDSWHRDELNYFLRQTLDEQSDRTVFPVVGSTRVLRDLPSLVHALPSYSLAEGQLAEVARGISARARSQSTHVDFDTASSAGRGRVFVAHMPEDRAWAEWVSWTLREAGYEVDQDWPGRQGDSFLTTVLGLPAEDRIVALYSAAFLGEGGMPRDQSAALLAMPEKFIALRVEEIDVPGAVQRHGFTDLFGVEEREAREALLRAVENPISTPTTPPAFPASGTTESRVPGDRPSAWNLPTRNAGFIARDDLMLEIKTRLTDSTTRAPLALTGPCGVGKSQLAIEYAHHYRSEYDLVWYMQGAYTSSLAELAAALGCWQADSSDVDGVRALHQELRERSRWLLIFDGVENPVDLAGLLPNGDGHVLITSRNPHWRQVATTLEVDVLPRADAVALLTSRHRNLTKGYATQLAEALDGLPLALAQAAEALYVFPPEEYLQLLAEHPAETLDEDRPSDYPGGYLTAQLAMSLNKLSQEKPEAALLLRACVLLAPVPLPLTPTALGATPRGFRQLLMAMEEAGLARVSGGSTRLPRLTLAVLRDHLSAEQRAPAAAKASELLIALDPDDAPDAEGRWRELAPHFLAIAPGDLVTTTARAVALRACWYLMELGDYGQALHRLQDLYATWERGLGGDAVETLMAASYLARASFVTEDRESAWKLDSDVFDRQQRLIGPDHPDTLRTATNLAIDLAAVGRTEQAVALGENNLRNQRDVLGEDHPDTLQTAANLAIDLESLGRTADANSLRDDTIARMRRVLGHNHSKSLHAIDRHKLRLPPLGAQQTPPF